MRTVISVIVPVYNTEKYLRECIDSILMQTFTDFELLLINDGSTDGSGAICDWYAANDSRVRVFHKANGGVSSARNEGLSHVRGEWIAWVDADDTILPDMFFNLIKAAEEKDADIAYCDFISDDFRSYMPSDTTDKLTFINEYLFAPIQSLCITLCKTKVYTENGVKFLETSNLGEDLLVTSKLYFYSNRRAYVPQTLYQYRRTDGSMTLSGSTSKRVSELIDNIYALESFFRRNGVFNQLKESLACRILFAKQYYLYKERNIALWYSIRPWTRHYILKNQYNGKKGKLIEWCVIKLYRLCIRLATTSI